MVLRELIITVPTSVLEQLRCMSAKREGSAKTDRNGGRFINDVGAQGDFMPEKRTMQHKIYHIHYTIN